MTITSPILAAIALPFVVAIIILARRLPTRASRGMLRLSAMFLLLGIAGIDVRCDRPLKIAVLVDVSPSTRGATFRDPQSVIARLAPLLNGQAYSLHYFGDGLQVSGEELPIARTRLEVPTDADAVILMSDGRIDAPAILPRVYPVIDPMMDTPGDGRIVEMRIEGERVVVHASIERAARELRLNGALPDVVSVAPGSSVVEARFDAKATSVTASLDSADRWSENDRLTVSTLSDVPTTRWTIGLAIPGFESLAPSRVPTDLSDYLSTASIVLTTDARISDLGTDRLKQYVAQLGGTLICVGSPGALPAALREIVPLSAAPPTPADEWTILLDASGSMDATEPTGQSRWQITLAAAARALTGLSGDQRVTVMTFARSPKVIASCVAPSAAIEALTQLSDTAPAGPTGLRAALEAIAAQEPPRATRLLLVSDADADLGDIATLAKRLTAARVRVFALTTGESMPIRSLAEATGGRQLVRALPADWSTAMQSLAGTPVARPSERVETTGLGIIRGLRIATTLNDQNWLKQKSELLAGSEATPIVASWQSGSGRVVAVAAGLEGDGLAQVAKKVEQSVSDSRYSVTWDEANDRVRLIASDAGDPINSLHPSLVRGELSNAFEQIAPGTYEAQLARQQISSIGVVQLNGRIIARSEIAGRYAHEFDRIGNDRAALKSFADRSGGAVIEPGDVKPIAFQHATVSRSMTIVCAIASVLLMCGAIIAMRG